MTAVGHFPVLDLAGELVEPALRSAVDGLHPELARLCRYHLGWSDAADTAVGDGSQAKLLRAGLAVLAARAVGADPSAAVPAATAVELLHNFSLLHDDIMDGDRLRRGRPAAWVVYGVGPATLAGDALIALALRSLPAYHDRLVGTLTEMIAGQATDLQLERLPEATVADYLRATTKTTALIGCALELGARAGGADPATVDALRRSGQHLGVAWQVANDVEDLYGDSTMTGKPARGDLRRRKKTLPVVAVLANGAEAGARLAVSLAAAPTDARLAAEAALVDAAGGRELGERMAVEHLDRAVTLAASSGIPAATLAELTRLFRYVTFRDPGPVGTDPT